MPSVTFQKTISQRRNTPPSCGIFLSSEPSLFSYVNCQVEEIDSEGRSDLNFTVKGLALMISEFLSVWSIFSSSLS